MNTYYDDNFYVVGLDNKTSGNNNLKNFIEIDCDLTKFAKEKIYRNQISSLIKDSIPKDLKEFNIVNNAADQILKPVTKLEWEDWEKSLAVNSIAPFFVIKELLDILNSTNSHIINISSIHGKLTKSNFAAYAASKAALESITRSLAIELSPNGISVNCVAPAAIMTDMLKLSFNGNKRKLKDLENRHPAKKIASPSELAIFIKSLTDSKGKFLTGSVINFSGGISNLLNDPD